MSEAENNALDKAERLMRRLLERAGSALDNKVAAEGSGLTAKRVGQIYSLLETAIESNLRHQDGERTLIAPNNLKLLLTYEERSSLSDGYAAALAHELKLAASEFITDRRYQTIGPITVEVGSDLFAKSSSVKATFVAASSAATESTPPEGEIVRGVQIQKTGGQSYNLRLTSGEGPVYIGRAAGNAIRIDDESVSRVHCSLALRSTGQVVLCDLGSSNGTWVNGQIVNHGEARVLGEGDAITVGDVSLNIVFL